MADANSVDRAARGVEESGWPYPWRFAYSRHERNFGDVVNDPDRGPWYRQQPDSTWHAGHTDSYEQIVPISEQVAWTHTFSDGIKRDLGDCVMEIMEWIIDTKRRNGLPGSYFTNAEEQAKRLEGKNFGPPA